MKKTVPIQNIARRPARAIVVALAALTVLPGAVAAQSIEQKAQVCSTCHGAKGAPQQPTTPVIWGQQLGYLYVQLRDFKSGARKNDQMSPVAATLERDDMMALAQYFSQKPWPDLAQPPASKAAAEQALRATTCTSCHQENYQGEGTQPRLAGQHKDCLAQTMLDFRNGKRGNNPGMSDLMKSISESDMRRSPNIWPDFKTFSGPRVYGARGHWRRDQGNFCVKSRPSVARRARSGA